MMRFERIDRRTWLLGGTAAGALLLLILTMAGVGGYTRTLESDPSLVPPLPVLPTPVAPPSVDQEVYADIAARPLFSEDRRPKPFVMGNEESTANVFDYVLTSVLIVPPLEMAILQSTQGDHTVRLKTGQSLPAAQDWRLVSVTARSAVFEGPEGERTLQMRVYDGTGGGMVTATDASPVMQAQSPSASVPAVSQSGQEHRISDDATRAATAAAPTAQSQESQMEAIRRRIEARRAELSRRPDPTPPVATK